MALNYSKKTTHFGYQEIPVEEKTERVAEVFHSVAEKYDVMNDLMSLGIHRLWKRFAIDLLAAKKGQQVLDVAAGTGDLALKLARRVGEEGRVVLIDINESMLQIARRRLIDHGLVSNIDYIQANAEQLPLANNEFEGIIMGFGLRNVTDKAAALSSLYRVLKPGYACIILEFSHPTLEGVKSLYDTYSFSILPRLGKMVANDEASYRYLAESIRMHPNQETLKTMMQQAGFENCDVHNLSGGIVAIHRGYKF